MAWLTRSTTSWSRSSRSRPAWTALTLSPVCFACEIQRKLDLPPSIRSVRRVCSDRVEGEADAQEAPHPGTDHSEAARSGGRAVQRLDDDRRRSDARNHRADLLPVAERVRRPSSRPGEASEGVREGERRVQEAAGRASSRQRDSQGSCLAKLLSPARSRRAVVHVRTRLGVSERRACRALGQHGSTQRHRPAAGPEGVCHNIAIRPLSQNAARTPYPRPAQK